MKKIFLSFSIIFIVLTFVGAGYVFYTGGNANAGFAVIPMIWAIIFLVLYKNKKKTDHPE